jgi:hypothetical protein
MADTLLLKPDIDTGPILDKDGFISICMRLSTGMILRCAAVCKNWSDLCKSDDLWTVIMKLELKGEARLSSRRNMSLNYEIIQIWKKEFIEKYKKEHVKDIYIHMRRERIICESRRDSTYRTRMRIFPAEIKDLPPIPLDVKLITTPMLSFLDA